MECICKNSSKQRRLYDYMDLRKAW